MQVRPLTTAGLYETSGDWLYEVGLPGKSGIGGGIFTVSRCTSLCTSSRIGRVRELWTRLDPHSGWTVPPPATGP